MTFAPLRTERLDLRRIRRGDAAAIHRYMGDAAVTRWLPEGTLDEAAARAYARRQAGRAATAVAVLERETGELVGHMPFHPWFGEHTYEVGWIIAPDRQGRGYATEAAAALLDRAFGALACHRVIATCQPQNPPSWRVMEKLGMRREAHFVSALPRPDGTWWDEYVYAILADEHAAFRAARPA